MSGSGQKRMTINTRERAISTDINRLGDFEAAFLCDALHQLFDPTGGSTDSGNGVAEALTSLGPIGTPLGGLVLGGLMVIAPVGGTQLSVTPGTALLQDIDGLAGSAVLTTASPDDSVAKLCTDPAGIQAGDGTLVLTANASGSTRVDVVEIRRSAAILETASRDIYDPTTGLFTPALVTKVTAGRIEYRIRLGTPAAGLPANVQGWLPICVIGVPNGATLLDSCVLYDVRPLARDRESLFTESTEAQPYDKYDFETDLRTAGGERRLFGIMKSRDTRGYRAGGTLRSYDGAADQTWINLQQADLREPGFVSAADTIVYLWLCYPGNLPRWVRYSKAAVAPYGGRVPQGMYGVLVMSNKAPLFQANSFASSAISMPTNSLLTGTSTQIAHLLLSIPQDSSANITGVSVRDKRVKWILDPSLASNGLPLLQVAPTASTATEDRYELIFGALIPKNAKRVLVRVQTRFTGAAAAAFTYAQSGASCMDPLSPITDQAIFEQSTIDSAVFDGTGAMVVTFFKWLDLPPMIPQLTAYNAVTRHRVRVAWAQSAAATKDATQSLLSVWGWEM